MVFVSGPRQSGKTTMARAILSRRHRASAGRYLNWDDDEARTRVFRREFPRDGLVVFDELHKFSRWRNFLKGLYDEHRARFVECKVSEATISPSLLYLRRKFPAVDAVQVLATRKVDRVTQLGVRLVSADRFLAELVL